MQSNCTFLVHFAPLTYYNLLVLRAHEYTIDSLSEQNAWDSATITIQNTVRTTSSGGYRFWGGGGARMVGVAGGGVGFWPDTKSGGGGGVLSVYGPIRGAGGGGGGVLSDSGPKRRAGGGGGGGAVGFWPHTKGGGRGEYDRVSGGPGYSTVVEFMRADINRQRNRAAIL